MQPARSPRSSRYKPLDPAEARTRLGELSRSWRIEDQKRLIRTFEFRDYRRRIRFVNSVAEVAERLDHHPQMTVGMSEVEVSIYTHITGGLTSMDFEFATAVDRIADD